MGTRLIQTYTEVGEHVIHGWCSKERANTRTAVVLLHGIVVSNAYMLPLARRLARHYSIYAPSLPGHGRSSKPSEALTMDQLAEVVNQWMQLQNLDAAVLAANSFGCQIAARLALNYPTTVSKLILIGIPDHTESSFLLQLSKLLLDAAYEQSSIIPLVLQDFWKTSPLLALETYKNMRKDDIINDLPKLETPTLIIRGEHDLLVPKRWVGEINSLLPHSTVKKIAEAGHAANFSKPDETAKLIISFIEQDQIESEHAA